MEIIDDKSATSVEETAQAKTEATSYVLKPRKRWGKILKLLVVVAALAGFGHAYWGREKEEELDREVQVLWSRGEPLRQADFEARQVADGENAAILLREAAQSIESSGAYERFQFLELKAPLGQKELAVIAQVLEENRAVLDKVRKARGMKAVSWNLPRMRMMVDIPVQAPNEQRVLGNLLMGGIYYWHQKGNDWEAVEMMRDLVRMIRAMHQIPRGVHGQDVALAMSSKMVEMLFTIAPELSVGQTAGAAHPEELRALIDELLDEREIWEGARMAIRWERAMAIEFARASCRGDYGDRCVVSDDFDQMVRRTDGFITKPRVMEDARVLCEQGRLVLALMDITSDWSSFDARARSSMEQVERSKLPSQGIEGMLGSMYRLVAERRIAAVMLAMTWCSAEHDARRPVNLAELTPRYLAFVPKDPFDREGGEIRYRWERKPALYSVGMNGSDEGGSEKQIGYPGCDRWRREDVVIKLAPEEWEKVWAKEERVERSLKVRMLDGIVGEYEEDR